MNTKVAFALAFALSFAGIVGNHAEAAKRKPDLIVSAVSAPSSTSPGATIVVSGTIKNQGRASSKAFGVAYYLSTSPSSTRGAAVLGTENVSSLAAGASVAIVTSLAIPGSTTSGTYYVVAVVDSTKVISESNERNNTRASNAVSVTDSTPPTISAVSSSGMTASSATITWMTDEASTSQVEYGLTTAYGSTSALDTSKVTSHGATLNGLAAGAAYHFRVRSTDAAGNTALSSDYAFTTAEMDATAASTTGTTYYVAPTGNDGNPGTETLPFRTLSHGVSVLTPGDTLYVMSGTYAEASINNIPGGSSWNAPVTVAAHPGHTVTIRPNSGAVHALQLQDPTQAYIIIDGFSFDGINLTEDPISIVSGPGTVETAAHHIRIQNCEIKNSSGNGIFVKYAYANEFINLDVHHNGSTSLDHGIYIKSSGNLIERSRVYSNAGYGIHLYNNLGGVDNNIVRGNQVYGNGERGILLGSGDGNLAYNNLLWGNLRGGITINYGAAATNTGVYNNTLYENDQLGIYVGAASTGAIVRNNLLYQNGSGVLDAGAGTVSDHNLTDIDPKFVNAVGGDFQLQSGSPAFDTGTAVSIVASDFNGMARPQGAAYNIGAFE